jgi:hypothetical protein
MGNGNETVFEPNCPGGPASIRENFGFAQHELNVIQKALGEHVPLLCRAWEEMLGYA